LIIDLKVSAEFILEEQELPAIAKRNEEKSLFKGKKAAVLKKNWKEEYPFFELPKSRLLWQSCFRSRKESATRARRTGKTLQIPTQHINRWVGRAGTCGGKTCSEDTAQDRGESWGIKTEKPAHRTTSCSRRGDFLGGETLGVRRWKDAYPESVLWPHRQ